MLKIRKTGKFHSDPDKDLKKIAQIFITCSTSVRVIIDLPKLSYFFPIKTSVKLEFRKLA